jgi:predicted esterase
MTIERATSSKADFGIATGFGNKTAFRNKNVSGALFVVPGFRRLTAAIALGVVLFAPTSATAQPFYVPAPQPATVPANGFLNRSYRDSAGEHKYVVFIPRNYSKSRKHPVILFLHGAGERGRDGFLPTTVGLGPFVKLREKDFPFIVVFPQCEKTDGRILTAFSAGSEDGERALRILAEVEKQYSIDPKHRILCGWSMGAYGAWSLAAEHPEMFSALVPIAGADPNVDLTKLTAIPVWAIHGERDAQVRCETTRQVVEALRALGGRVRYSHPEDGDHGVWTRAFDNDDLYKWMLDPSDTPSDDPPLPPAKSNWQTVSNPTGKTLPFNPELDVPNAIYVRLGNDALAALSDSVPYIVPANVLSGSLPDFAEAQSASGVSFTVSFTGMAYQARLDRAIIKAVGKNRLNVQFIISNIAISIGGIYMDGGARAAAAGGTAVYIGHVRPVVLSFDVAPTIRDRKLRLQLLNTSFSISPDNYAVSGPGGISVQGLGVTQERVREGIVSGLYSGRTRVEQQVISVVPNIIAQLESKLDVSQADRVLTAIWPLPGYQPRLRTWPNEIETDADGVSLSLGLTAASLDPEAKPKWVIIPPIGPGVKEIPAVRTLQVGANPQLLAPLTQMVAKAGLARVDVLDTPSPKMHRLADRTALSEWIPDVKRLPDDTVFSSEFSITGPMRFSDGGHGIRFEMPRAELVISTAEAAAPTKFKPYVVVDLNLQQTVTPKYLSPSQNRRALELDWGDDLQLTATARFAEGIQPHSTELDAEKIQAAIAEGWREFNGGGSATATALPDIDLGYARLRAIDAGWASPFLTATFGPAGVRISNRTEKPLVYEVKSFYSAWSQPLTLAPGKDHVYTISVPLGFRHKTQAGTYEEFQLPAGSHSEYRAKKPGERETLYAAPDLPVSAPSRSGETQTAGK